MNPVNALKAVLLVAALAAPVAMGRDAHAETSTQVAAPKAYRAHWANADLYVPTNFHAEAGAYDVVFHFHGMAAAQEKNVEATNLNAVIVTVNVGVGSDPYDRAMSDPHAFDQLVATTAHFMKKSGRADGAQMGRIALSAWSAGFASVGAILKNHASKIDAVLIADGVHAAYSDEKKKTVDERSLQKYARFAEDAMAGKKLMVLTHSSIPMPGYASTTEAIGTVLRLVQLEKGAPATSAPRKMKPIYQSERGQFHVEGFEGTDIPAHLDHIYAMGDTMFSRLATRWSKPAAIQAS